MTKKIVLMGLMILTGLSGVCTNKVAVKADTEVYAPPQVKIINVSQKKKAVNVLWKKISNIKKYQLEFSRKKSMKDAKSRTTYAIRKDIKNLRKNQVYYIRVRAYRVDESGEKIYGEWSKIHKIKTK